MINVITPLYNDWASLETLVKKLRIVESNPLIEKINLFCINDCSTLDCKINFEELKGAIQIISMNRNIGHQKSIAIGLSYIANLNIPCATIIMDSDGEDKPEDIIKLIEALKIEPDRIIFAKRKKRNEGLNFIFFYKFYKIIFRTFTGQNIAFGNFCCIPYVKLKKVVSLHEIWNHFSGGIVKSKIPYNAIEIDRGIRYEGKSKMNFTSLIIHGLSAISVHLETVLVRVLIATIIGILFSCLIVIIAISMKLVFKMASPGWTTSVITGSFIVIFQFFLATLLLSFQVLNNRSLKLFLPIKDYHDFIENIEVIKISN